MEQQVRLAAGKPEGDGRLQHLEAQSAAYAGQLRKSQEFLRRAISAAEGAGNKEGAPLFEAVAALTPENPTSEIMYRFLRPIGGVVWLKSSGRGFFDREQKLVRVVGMVADVTEHKKAEEAMSNMSSMLIQAQERERTRIGRELHDDINQRLAMLAVELEQLGDDPRTLSEPSTGSPKRGGRDFERRPGPVSRVALLKTGVSRCGGGHEKLAQGVR